LPSLQPMLFNRFLTLLLAWRELPGKNISSILIF
jgi:hypothetical protein